MYLYRKTKSCGILSYIRSTEELLQTDNGGICPLYVTNTWKVETEVQGKCGLHETLPHPLLPKGFQKPSVNSTYWRGWGKSTMDLTPAWLWVRSQLGLHFKTLSQKNWRVVFKASSLKLEPSGQSKGVSLRTENHTAAAQRALYWESACSRGARLRLTPKTTRG